ncbi:ATP phosphoribosyltransferase [bacterium]|nr:ATP phosphoribosyltransferase [bacterium]
MKEYFDNQNTNRLRIALPKGSLQSDTLVLFQKAGYQVTGYEAMSKNYRPKIDDEQLVAKISRPQEIPLYVKEGYYDLGITGLDWILETKTNAYVEQVLDLKYGFIKIVLAAPVGKNNSIGLEIKSFEDLNSLPKEEIRISTEYLNISSNYIFEKIGVGPRIITPWWTTPQGGHFTLILSFGATEAKPPDEADAIIDNTASGGTLRENDLDEIDCLLARSTAMLIANPKSLKDPWKKGKINEVAQAFQKSLSRRTRESIPAHF